jgi:hypothetical protein
MYLYEGKCVCPIAVELIYFAVSKQSKPKLYVKSYMDLDPGMVTVACDDLPCT